MPWRRYNHRARGGLARQTIGERTSCAAAEMARRSDPDGRQRERVALASPIPSPLKRRTRDQGSATGCRERSALAAYAAARRPGTEQTGEAKRGYDHIDLVPGPVDAPDVNPLLPEGTPGGASHRRPAVGPVGSPDDASPPARYVSRTVAHGLKMASNVSGGARRRTGVPCEESPAAPATPGAARCTGGTVLPEP